MIALDLDVDGLTEAVAKLSRELEAEGRKVMTRAGAMAAAKARELAPVGETAALRNSIQGEPAKGSFAAGTLEGSIVALAPYASHVEAGTRPHEIRPKHRRFLRIPVQGGFLFRRRVMHPGTRPQPYLAPAVELVMDDVSAEFEAAMEIALIRAGFG